MFLPPAAVLLKQLEQTKDVKQDAVLSQGGPRDAAVNFNTLNE